MITIASILQFYTITIIKSLIIFVKCILQKRPRTPPLRQKDRNFRSLSLAFKNMNSKCCSDPQKSELPLLVPKMEDENCNFPFFSKSWSTIWELLCLLYPRTEFPSLHSKGAVHLISETVHLMVFESRGKKNIILISFVPWTKIEFLVQL